MKSIRQKAKAYDNALEIAKSKWHYKDKPCFVDVTELFPELKENRDEEIRKKLINLVNKSNEQGGYALHKWEADEMLAWLEKLKVFAEHGYGLYDFGNNGFTYIGNTTCDNVSLLEKQDEQKPIDDLTQQEAMDIAVAKCFEQGGQKPVDKVEPFDKFAGLTDFERTLADICIGWIGEELGWKQYIKDNADVLLKIAVEKFNSVQDAPFERKSATIDIDKMVDNYANNKERDNEEFGKPVPCMIRAYRRGINDALSALNIERNLKIE